MVRLHDAYAEKLRAPLSAESAQTTAFLLARTPGDVVASFNEKMQQRKEAGSAIAKGIEAAWRAIVEAHFWLGTELVDILNRRYAEWWYRVADTETAVAWLRSNPVASSATAHSASFWGRLRARYVTRRDDRALARLEFKPSEVRTDITRIVDHISP